MRVLLVLLAALLIAAALFGVYGVFGLFGIGSREVAKHIAIGCGVAIVFTLFGILLLMIRNAGRRS